MFFISIALLLSIPYNQKFKNLDANFRSKQHFPVIKSIQDKIALLGSFPYVLRHIMEYIPPEQLLFIMPCSQDRVVNAYIH